MIYSIINQLISNNIILTKKSDAIKAAKKAYVIGCYFASETMRFESFASLNKSEITVIDWGSRSDRPRYRVTTPTLAELRRCRWFRPRNAARLAALARSWWRDSKNLRLISLRSRYSCSTHILALTLTLTYDLDFYSRWSWPITHTHAEIKFKSQSIQKIDRHPSRTQPMLTAPPHLFHDIEWSELMLLLTLCFATRIHRVTVNFFIHARCSGRHGVGQGNINTSSRVCLISLI